MTGAMPDGGVWLEEDLDGRIAEVKFGNKVLEKRERGKRIVESIVPTLFRGMVAEID